MADTQVLGTCVFGRAGSSPASRTHLLYRAFASSFFIELFYRAFIYVFLGIAITNQAELEIETYLQIKSQISRSIFR